MRRLFWLAFSCAILFCLWMAVWSYHDGRRREMEYAYAMGSGVQFTGEGALILCNGEAVYLGVRHNPGTGEYVHRYVEAVCS